MNKIFTVFFLLLGFTIIAQDSPWYGVDKSPLDGAYYPSNSAWRNYLDGDDRNKNMQIKVLYSRPQKNDREIFGALIPYGKEWRLGANEASTISFRNAVDFGGVVVPRGKYSMFATPGEKEWTISLSSELGLWGSANRDQSKTVASVQVPVIMKDNSEEALSITFQEVDDNNINMAIQWDKTRVHVPIGLKPVLFSPMDASPMDMVTYPGKASGVNYLKGDEKNVTPKIQVTYGRPYKKNRNIFGDLVKMESVWRVGANESTEVTFYEDVSINGTEIKAGQYGLYAHLHEGSWDMIFSTDIPAWGAVYRDEEKDVAKVTVPTQKIGEVVENLTIYFDEVAENNVNMIIGWDQTMVSLPIMIK
jgi:hypothetical protein